MEAIDEDKKLVFEGFSYFFREISCTDRSARRKYPLILLSGAFQDMNSWRRYVNAFKNEYTIILLDLPGTGKSDFLPETYGLEFMTNALLNVVANLDTEKVEIVAVSYGTPIGYSFAKKFPQKIAHLVLCGTMRKIPDDKWEATAHTVKTLSENNMHEFVMQVLNSLTYREQPEKINNFYLVERILYSCLLKMNDDFKLRFAENTRRLLMHAPLDISSKMNTRTLVMTGEYDVFTRPEYCKEIARSIENSIFLTIRNADHLFHLEQFDATEQIIRNFLQDKPLENMAEIKEIEYL
ncbi:MAG: alpha/beta hydrolase [Bacteroidota bacterium]